MSSYHEWIPQGPLEPYVAKIWSWDGPLPAGEVMRFLPSGTAQLFFSFSRVKFVARRAGSNAWEELAPQVFIGPQFSYFDITTAPMRQMAGVIFKPGGTLPFFDGPAKDLVDQLLPLDAVTSSPLGAELLAPNEVQSRLTDWLQGRLLVPDEGGRILETLAGWDGKVSRVDSLGRRFGLSGKRLASRFEALFGVLPKRFARVRRFNGALRELFEQKNQVLVDVAAEIGCYDQPHLNREFRAFAGLSPAQYQEYAVTLYYFPLPGEPAPRLVPRRLPRPMSETVQRKIMTVAF